jgi:hypothetical protein
VARAYHRAYLSGVKSLPIFVSLALLAAACGDDDGGTPDAAEPGPPDAAAVIDVDAARPDAALPVGGSVTWSDELPNPYLIPAPGEDPEFGGVGLDFLLQYTVELPDPNVPSTQLEIEICSQTASATEPTCTTDQNAAAAGTTGYRWGLDPSTYEVGHNVYTHTLTLIQDGRVVDEAVLTFEVNATH